MLLHPAQAEAIVSALDKVPATVPADDLRVAERELVELARTHGPLDLRKAGRLIRDRLDTDGPEPDEQKAYDRESLTLKNADHGVAFTRLPGQRQRRTVPHPHPHPRQTPQNPRRRPRPPRPRQTPSRRPHHPPHHHRPHSRHHHSRHHRRRHPTRHRHPQTPPRAAHCERLHERQCAHGHRRHHRHRADRRRDAARHRREHEHAGSTDEHRQREQREQHGQRGISRRPGFTPGHGPKPHITVTIDFNDLKAATADKLGHLIYGDALSAATIRRLACDAHILPIVLGSDSQPLDVGTTVRLATGPIRKALITRDKGCVCCGAPPIYCDAHHVQSVDRRRRNQDHQPRAAV